MKLNYAFFFLLLSLSIVGCETEETEEKKTLEYSTVTDIDGHVYKTVKIGDHWWMAENLRVSRFNDGTSLSYISINDSNAVWSSTSLPTFTYINDTLFGYLYNGAVIQSEKQIAPAGWHIPTDAEWKDLEAAIGMSSVEQSLTGWRGEKEAVFITSEYSAGWPEGVTLFGDNSSGFNALPSGCRIHDGRTNISSNTAFWWSSSIGSNGLYYRYIDAQEERIFRHSIYPSYGMSIRCIKD
jgi:uncharacterized protein (TIGR02145 family)